MSRYPVEIGYTEPRALAVADVHHETHERDLISPVGAVSAGALGPDDANLLPVLKLPQGGAGLAGEFFGAHAGYIIDDYGILGA